MGASHLLVDFCPSRGGGGVMQSRNFISLKTEENYPVNFCLNAAWLKGSLGPAISNIMTRFQSLGKGVGGSSSWVSYNCF